MFTESSGDVSTPLNTPATQRHLSSKEFYCATQDGSSCCPYGCLPRSGGASRRRRHRSHIRTGLHPGATQPGGLFKHDRDWSHLPVTRNTHAQDHLGQGWWDSCQGCSWTQTGEEDLCYINLWRVVAVASPLDMKLGVVWCQNCHIRYLQRLCLYSYSASVKNSLCRWDLHYFSLVDLDTQNGTNYCLVTKIENTPNAWLNNFKKKNTMLETLANYLKCMSRHKATFLRAVLNMI